MTQPAVHTNGNATNPTPKRASKVRTADQETYHGVPVLTMRVGTPVPTPKAPKRYAVRVTPDLARHLLTFNHRDNRHEKTRHVQRYAEDMRRGLWRLSPHGPVFSHSGILQNGQNTLFAITEFGEPVWLVMDFGWPDDVIYVIDRGAARSTADSLKIDGVTGASNVAAAVSKWWQYQRLVGQRRSISGFGVPSAQVARSIIEQAPDTWTEAGAHGSRIYDRLDKAWGKSYWTAAFAILATAGVEHERIVRFFDEVGEGTGAPRSATRTLADWARRRPSIDTQSGDAREPLELIVRTFNAWQIGRSLSRVRQPGFEWSRVRA